MIDDVIVSFYWCHNILLMENNARMEGLHALNDVVGGNEHGNVQSLAMSGMFWSWWCVSYFCTCWFSRDSLRVWNKHFSFI